MVRIIAHGLLLLTALIWGMTFVFQATAMEQGLSPFAFTAFRFLTGTLALLPFAVWESKSRSIFFVLKTGVDHQKLLIGIIGLSVFMFVGSSLQQVSLGITSVANTAFLTTLYVPLVPLLGLVIFARNIRGLRWVAVGIFIMGSWFLSGASPATAVRGDTMVVIGAFFWAGHIMLVGWLVQRTKMPFQLAFIQTFVTMILSFLVLGFVETVNMAVVMEALPEIIFAGGVSTAFGFAIQLIAQQNCSTAAAAIILSLEGVIAAIAGWFLLDQSMTNIAIFGAGLIFLAVLIVELTPEHKKIIKRNRYL
ncbi:MAG: DMT family transporter [Candidatus Puniceispirillales bacterium WSBS_2018_MAG_OTU23]